MSQPKCEVETTKLNTHPLKNMKRIKSHASRIFDFTSVLFPSGKTKIVTCSDDSSLHIFDLESEKCEKIINHTSPLFSVHFYKEKQVLMATDFNGELCFWDLFSSKNEIKIIKKMKISKPNSWLWKLTQISSNFFFCCVQRGVSRGNIYSIVFEKKNLENIKIEEIEYPLSLNNRKDSIRCNYFLKSKKNCILFSGGDCIIRKFNFTTKKHFNFPKKHSILVLCLISYFNEKSEEIILSGSYDRKILFWTLSGKNIKEIKLNCEIYCFLNDFGRNNIFIATGVGRGDYSLFSLNLKTKKVIKIVENIHNGSINCMKWINEENQNKFISCSSDKSFSIFELFDTKQKEEKEDLKERINDLRDKIFILDNFSSENISSKKKMIFSIKLWNNVQIKRILITLLI